MKLKHGMRIQILTIAILFCLLPVKPGVCDDRTTRQDLKAMLQKSKHFTEWINANGIVSFILTTRVAPFQQSFYYTNPSDAADGTYLWFHTAFPPQRDRSLGIINFATDEVHHVPDTAFDAASPLVDSETGAICWVEPRSARQSKTSGYRIYKRGPSTQDTRTEIAQVPHFVPDSSPPRQVVTHLSLNAKKTALGFDSGNYAPHNATYAGVVPLDGSEAQTWGVFDRRYNHAMLNPMYEDVMLIAQDYYQDRSPNASSDAERIGIDNRMWLLFSDGQKLPIFPEPNSIYHEWWDAAGDAVWYIDKKGNRGGVGTCRVPIDIKNRTVQSPVLIWPNAVGHTHANREGTHLVGDHGYKSWEKTDSARVSFYNAASKTEIDIVTSMPFPEHQYHTHPHPQFTHDNKFICYTTTVLGYTTLALCSVDQLISSTK